MLNPQPVDAAVGEARGTARYVQALRQHWPFIIGTVALAVAAAAAYLLAVEKRYHAGTDVLVTPVPAADETFVGIPVLRESGESRSVLTVARLVKTPQVAEGVRRRLRVTTSRDDLLDLIRVRPQEQSNIVTIQSEASSAEDAARLANAFAQTLIQQRTAAFQRELRAVTRRLAAQLAQLREAPRSAEALALGQRLGDLRSLRGAPDPTLRVSSAAVPPLEAAWPRPALSLLVAVLAGALLGMGVAVGLEILNPLVLKEQDLLDAGLPIFARAPRIPASELRRLVSRSRPLPPAALDGYRVLRANLVAGDNIPPRILVTAPTEREEAWAATVGIAVAFASSGLQVLLLDADLRRPRVAGVLGVQERETDAASHEGEAEESVATPYDGLHLLPSSVFASDLLDLELDGFTRVLAKESADADVVVVHTPSPARTAESLLLADAADAVVVVVELGRTRQDRLLELVRALSRRGVRSAGFVVAGRHGRRSGASMQRGEHERRAERDHAAA